MGLSLVDRMGHSPLPVNSSHRLGIVEGACVSTLYGEALILAPLMIGFIRVASVAALVSSARGRKSDGRRAIFGIFAPPC